MNLLNRINSKFSLNDTTVNSEYLSSKTSSQIFGVIRANEIKKQDNLNSAKFNLKDKIKIPYLKKFNPKSIKREEIDKKIIRKFKKYLKERIKSNKLNGYCCLRA